MSSLQFTSEETPEIRVSVRTLVEFILRSGDIDNRSSGGAETAMIEGTRIHKKLQSSMGGNYRAEVPLSCFVDTGKYRLCIDGRADGIIEDDNGVTIDEIKGTYRNIERMQEPVPIHLAQAKCYAYMYGKDTGADEIRVRMTYCNLENEDVRMFFSDYTFEELESWFDGLVCEYQKWTDLKWEWMKTCRASIEGLEFPYEYRRGQRKLISQVYQAFIEKRKLFLEAPTGVGKTISTLFPAIHAMGAGLADRVFYLTAKTITRTAPVEEIAGLREKGLRCRDIVITAKDRICPICEGGERPECNPESCPYAKGHFDRVNAALYEMLETEEELTRQTVMDYAGKYTVCPFEMSLDASMFCDVIICDYNYLFDPKVALKRYFEGSSDGSNIFLIDEAHNLVDRGREMYSALLLKSSVSNLTRVLKKTILSETYTGGKKKPNDGQLTLLLTEQTQSDEQTDIIALDSISDDIEKAYDTLYRKGKKGKRSKGKSVLVREGYAQRMVHHLEKLNSLMLEMKRESEGGKVLGGADDLNLLVSKITGVIKEYLEEREEKRPDVVDDILSFYFDASFFNEIYDELDENYTIYDNIGDDGDFSVKLLCVDPSVKLRERMANGISSILFSATLLPIKYYKQLLGGTDEDYEVYAESVFMKDQYGVFIAGDVSTRYKRRNYEEYKRISVYIKSVTEARKGNYMVFFPSYSVMEAVYDIYTAEFEKNESHSGLPGSTVIMQSPNMKEEEREEFLSYFDGNGTVAFCVLGGIFGEGIDLRGDKLIGVIIVGTGLPMVGFERELLKDHFDNEGINGFDYAYRFPGMNKVCQAAGRVIRTVDDKGVIVLLDDRFREPSNQKIFPSEWQNYLISDQNGIDFLLRDFWS